MELTTAPLALVYNCIQWQNSLLLLTATTDYASRHSSWLLYSICLILQKAILDLISYRTCLDKFFMVCRSAQGTGWSGLDAKGFKGFQTWLVEEVGAGQEDKTSASRMLWCLCFCREAGAAQGSQTDGTVPDVSLDHLSDEEMNRIQILASLQKNKTQRVPIT